MNKMITFYSYSNRICGKLLCGSGNLGSSFLVDENHAITAYHCIKDIEDKICLSFSIKNGKIITYNVMIKSFDEKLDVAYLELETSVVKEHLEGFLPIKISDFVKDEEWESRIYYPNSDGIDFGEYCCGSIYNESPDFQKVGLQLKDGSKFAHETYSGSSGACVVINNCIQGIIINAIQSPTNAPFEALPVKYLQEFFDKNEISYSFENNYNSRTEYEKQKEIMGQIANPKSPSKIAQIADESNITITKFEQIVSSTIKGHFDNGKLICIEDTLESILLNKENHEVMSPDFYERQLRNLAIVYMQTKNEEGINRILDVFDAIDTKLPHKYICKINIALYRRDVGYFKEIIKEASNFIETYLITLYKAKFEFIFGDKDAPLKMLFSNGMICSEYENEFEALDIIAESYIANENFDKALYYFNRANDVHNSFHNKFAILKTQTLIISNRIGNLSFINEPDKQEMEKLYNELTQIEFFFSNFNAEYKVEYWKIRFLALQSFDLDKCIYEYNNLDDEIKNHPNIIFSYADCLSYLHKYKEATAEYMKLFDLELNPAFINNALSSIASANEYRLILDLESKIPTDKYDSEGKIASIFVSAYKSVYGAQAGIDKFDSFLSNNINGPFLYLERAIIAHEFNDNGSQKHYLRLAEESLDKKDIARIYFYRFCESYDENELGLLFIEPISEFSLTSRRHYIECLIHLQKYNEALSSIDKYLVLDEAYDILRTKAYILYLLNNKVESAKYNLKSFRIKNGESTATNYAISLLEIGQAENVELDVIKFLSEIENTNCQIIVSNIYYARGDMNSYSLYLRKSILLCSQFDEKAYLNFIFNMIKHPGNMRNVDIIDIEQVIVLESENRKSIKQIAIHEDSGYIPKEGSSFANCIHITKDNNDYLLLKGKKVGNSVTYKSEKYKVLEISDINMFLSRFCFSVYTTERPDSPALKAYKVDLDNPLKEILPVLISHDTDTTNLLNGYNFKKSMGLPLYSLCRDYEKLIDLIFFLFNNRQQTFFAGNPEKMHDNSKILFSISSIIIATFIGIDKIIDTTCKEIFINRITIEIIKGMISHYDDNLAKVVGTLGIHNGKVFMQEISEDEKFGRLQFLQNILEFSLSLTPIEEEIVELSKEQHEVAENIKETVGPSDLELYKSACTGKYTIICDDLFLRKCIALGAKNVNQTNCSVFLLDEKQNISDILQKFDVLAKANYSFFISADFVDYVLYRLNSNIIIITDYLRKFKDILINQLSDLEILQFVFRGIIERTHVFLETNIATTHLLELVKVVYSSLFTAFQTNSLPTDTLRKFILLNAVVKCPSKTGFVEEIFSEIDPE